ncbi:MAG: hotdog domain-containing protein [Balneolales bacterium]
MNFYTRKMVKPEDLNPNNTLFGGILLRWVDEEAAIFAICQLDNHRVVTKFISEINFVSSAKMGDVLEMGMEVVKFGRTSITFRCVVRNKFTHTVIITIDKLVFVSVDEQGQPEPHNKTRVQEDREVMDPPG